MNTSHMMKAQLRTQPNNTLLECNPGQDGCKGNADRNYSELVFRRATALFIHCSPLITPHARHLVDFPCTMAMLSNIASKVKDMRLVPPTEEEEEEEEKQEKEKASSSEHNGKDANEPGPTPKRPILEITSYDRFTPPSPTPDVEYDCRVTHNPSAQVRKTCTGLDAMLQEELMSRSSFSDLVSRAEGDIRRLMEVKDVRASREGERAIVRVGCLCGSGHHRSVAFAERLGKVRWCEQGEWEVRVKHRDLTVGVEEMKRVRSEKRRRGGGKGGKEEDGKRACEHG